MERLLETVSYRAGDEPGLAVQIDRDYVDRQLGELARDEDLAKYIL
jgi:ATP-dependent HslUV protease ATP-binding subunit HslU